jgi:hypothetical protein
MGSVNAPIADAATTTDAINDSGHGGGDGGLASTVEISFVDRDGGVLYTFDVHRETKFLGFSFRSLSIHDPALVASMGWPQEFSFAFTLRDDLHTGLYESSKQDVIGFKFDGKVAIAAIRGLEQLGKLERLDLSALRDCRYATLDPVSGWLPPMPKGQRKKTLTVL